MVTAVVETRRMWPGGPLRQWAQNRPNNNFITYAGGGYVGSYVCTACGMTCDGVYRARRAGSSTEWACRACLRDGLTQQEAPGNHRMRAYRRAEEWR